MRCRYPARWYWRQDFREESAKRSIDVGFDPANAVGGLCRGRGQGAMFGACSDFANRYAAGEPRPATDGV